MKGICRFCGQVVVVEDGFTQPQADAEATLECSCSEGKAYRDNMHALETIYEICTEPDEDCMRNMTEEEADNIVSLASCIMDGLFDKAVITAGESTITISRSSKGKLECTRSRIVEIGV